MQIISRFVQEQKRYSYNELVDIFELSFNEAEIFIRNLKAFDILKTVKKKSEQREYSDLLNEDIEVVDFTAKRGDWYYIFTYVGVLTIGNRIIKCYPKYIGSNEEPVSEMKQILKVLEAYNSKEQIINMFNGNSDNMNYNLLAVILFLLNDYHENGLYYNIEEIYEEDSIGEILWDKTINEGFCLISNKKPYYVNLYTRRAADDEQDFFKRLHECVLTECSKKMEDSDLLNLFSMTGLELSEESLEAFGETEYILNMLQMELDIQFNTRKQLLLKTLYSYVSYKNTSQDNFTISMFGTNNFNLVWEKACSEVFNNQLNYNLRYLELNTPLSKEYSGYVKLIDIIEKPIWRGIGSEKNSFIKEANETLIPDIVVIETMDKEPQLIILDAKYYTIVLEKEKVMRGNPGINDVTKQYLYQLAFQKFADTHQIKSVKNCFLFPTEKEQLIKKGSVSMSMMNELGLSDIQIRLIPAKKLFDYYLSHEHLSVSILELD